MRAASADPASRTTSRFTFTYAHAGLFAFALVVALFFRARLTDNEAVHLVGSRVTAEPGFLANDWTIGQAAGRFHVFDAIVAPLWVLGDAHRVAWTARLVVWGAVVVTLARLARALGIGPAAFAAGFAAWLLAGQSAAAGELVFEGAEPKVLSYALLALALERACRARALAAGALGGAAFLVHPAVGGYGAIGLAAAVAVAGDGDGNGNGNAHGNAHGSAGARAGLARRAVLFAVGFAPFAVPVAAFAAAYFERPEAAPAADPDAVARTIAFLRNAHHVDPAIFLTRGAVLRLAVSFGGLVLATLLAFAGEARRARIAAAAFVLALGAAFAAGLVAAHLGAAWFLATYPFRVGPVFSLLLFSMLAASLGLETCRGARARKALALGLAGAALCLALHGVPGAVRAARNVGGAWRAELRAPAPGGAIAPVAAWIRTHTHPHATFVAPPREARFWLLCERAQVVAFKLCPANAHALEWRERIVAANGGREPERRSYGLLDELAAAHVRLGVADLARLRDLYGADYYLTTAARADLRAALCYEDGAYFVYDLASVGPDGQ